jgi:16S rRNA (uracil1498-N3)-methyltransferase
MRRFHAPELTRESTSVEISGAEFAHMKKVLRLKVGTEVELFNGRDTMSRGTIASIEKGYAVVDITGVVDDSSGDGLNESPIGIILVQAMVKGAKPEFIIQKATELGVAEVRLYASGRSVPVVFGKPAVGLYGTLKEALGTSEGARGLLFTVASSLDDPSGDDPSGDSAREPVAGLGTALKGFEGCDSILAVVGPEGGLDEREKEDAVEAGLTPVSLGPRTLRTETAAVTVLSVLQYALGDLG